MYKALKSFTTADVNVAGGVDEYNMKMETVITSTYNSVVSNIKEVPLIDISALTSITSFFQDFKSLETVPVLDTSHITKMLVGHRRRYLYELL